MFSGSGILLLISVTIPGLVPQVTCGKTSFAFNFTVISNSASGSDGSFFHEFTAKSNASPCGAKGRFFRCSKVFSSGATIPARAPASIVMLQRVIRPSIVMERIASPAYSITQPDPPAIPIFPIIARIISLGVTVSESTPSTCTSIVLGFFCCSV